MNVLKSEEKSRDLLKGIKQKPYTRIEELEVGNFFLMGRTIVQVLQIKSNYVTLARLTPNGSLFREFNLDRFEGQKVKLITEEEKEQAVEIASAVGGFKPKEWFDDDFYKAVGQQIELHENLSR